MSNNGYCLAYRKSWNHDAFTDLLEAAVWNFLYQNAFYEDGERTFNGVLFNLKRGQIVTTPRFLAKGFRISESNARRILKKLNKRQSIEIQTTTKATIITICNYDKYQPLQKTNDEQTTIKRKTNDANNNKRNNKLNNKKDIIINNIQKEPTKVVCTEEFENFWDAYGKIGNKQPALKAYNKIKGVNYAEIINGLRRYQQYCQSTGQYIKHASTWLNARGWEDEYPITSSQPNAEDRDWLARMSRENTKFH